MEDQSTSWMSGGVLDQRLFNKICDHHKMDKAKKLKTIQSIQHCIKDTMVHVTRMETDKETGKATFTKTGEKVLKEAIFVRTKGSGSVHRVFKSDKDNLWLCDCPGWMFKGGRDHLKPCKHILYCIVYKLGKQEDWLQYIV